jgi:NADPH-dependent curcumin reductase CurA
MIGHLAEAMRGFSALGCKVIATASTEDKRRICKEKGGADHTIDYTKAGWQVSCIVRVPESIS